MNRIGKCRFKLIAKSAETVSGKKLFRLERSFALVCKWQSVFRHANNQCEWKMPPRTTITKQIILDWITITFSFPQIDMRIKNVVHNNVAHSCSINKTNIHDKNLFHTLACTTSNSSGISMCKQMQALGIEEKNKIIQNKYWHQQQQQQHQHIPTHSLSMRLNCVLRGKHCERKGHFKAV